MIPNVSGKSRVWRATVTPGQEIEAIKRHREARPAETIIRRLLLSEMHGGNNPKRRAVAPDGSVFVVKWSKNNDGRLPEINEREELTSVLGRLVGVEVVDAWVIPSNLLPEE